MSLPQGFVYLADIVPDIITDIRYYSTYNFVGERIDGYKQPVAICTEKAALAFKKVADKLKDQGYLCRIFDTYRPQKAVAHFVRWGQDLNDQKMKEYFYPDVPKENIIPDGYISPTSKHCRGSVIDLTLVDIATGQDLDMGTMFDFFGVKSHPITDLITPQQQANRDILRLAMEAENFEISKVEWWHFVYLDEPFPDTNFDFDVE